MNLSLPPELVAVLDRISAVTNAGRASIIREWLVTGLPQWEQIAQALELATSRKLDAFKLLERTLDQTMEQAGQMKLDIKRTTRRMRRKPPA